MLVIPAIDLRGGRCVRLVQGDFARETVFSDDPVEMARRWEAEGAKRLHVVDLDGARLGAPSQLDTVARMASAVRIPLQLGGGLRTAAHLAQAIDAGIDRAILGTVAVRDPKLVEAACDMYGDRVIVGVDARDGRVAVEGWVESTDVAASELIARMRDVGVRTVIYTDIGRDGTLGGPNLDGLREAARVGVPIIASGGVASVDDVRALAAMEDEGVGVVGAIVGQALYTGAIRLSEAVRAAETGADDETPRSGADGETPRARAGRPGASGPGREGRTVDG